MAVLGFDLSSLRDALGQLQTSVRQGVQQAQPASGQPDYLGYLGSMGAPSGMQGPAMQAVAHPAPQSVSGVLGGGSAYDTLAQMAQVGPSLSQAALGSLYQQASSVPSSLSSTWDSLTAFASQQAQKAAAAAAAAANVARWGSQAQQAFGDILDPDVMLAIMTNESGGDPNAYNSAGNAYGLFQQVGFGDGDPNWASNTNGQFQAARQLAQQKLAGINAAYAANGLNPDARTRARDFALAWAGHFDYSTGTPNPNSRDVGSGQTAQQLGDIFLANYDRIKAGRQAPVAAAGGSGMLAGPWAFPVVGYQGQVQNHWGTDETGASDIMAAAGTPIVAMHGGRVIDASWDQYGGNTVAIQDEQGRVYYYAHMQSAAQVQTGQTVQAGTPLGAVGNTGDAAGGPTHLHLGITAPNTNIKLGNGAQGGAGWAWGSGPQDNAVGLLTWVLHGGSAPTGGGGAQYR